MNFALNPADDSLGKVDVASLVGEHVVVLRIRSADYELRLDVVNVFDQASLFWNLCHEEVCLLKQAALRQNFKFNDRVREGSSDLLFFVEGGRQRLDENMEAVFRNSVDDCSSRVLSAEVLHKHGFIQII